MNNTTIKKCSKCGVEKEFTTKYFATRYSRGIKSLRMECKACWNKRHRSYEHKKQPPREKVDINCEVCGNKFKGRPNAKYCSDECSYKQTLKRTANKKRIKKKKCKICLKIFETEYKCGSYTYCSIGCVREAERKLKREIKQKQKYKKKALKHSGKFDNGITLKRVINKYNNVCYLCGDECNQNDYIITVEGHFIVGPNYPSIEHIHPISKGGSHTWDNINLAHCRCNSDKRDSVLFDKSGQMTLSI